MSKPVTLQSGSSDIVTNELQQPLIMRGSTVPTDGSANFSPGCIFIRTSGNGIGSSVYINESSDPASCDFNSIT